MAFSRKHSRTTSQSGSAVTVGTGWTISPLVQVVGNGCDTGPLAGRRCVHPAADGHLSIPTSQGGCRVEHCGVCETRCGCQSHITRASTRRPRFIACALWIGLLLIAVVSVVTSVVACFMPRQDREPSCSAVMDTASRPPSLMSAPEPLRQCPSQHDGLVLWPGSVPASHVSQGQRS